MKLSELQIGQKLLLNDVEFEFFRITNERRPGIGNVPLMVFVSSDESEIQYFTPKLFSRQLEQISEGVYRFAEIQQ